MYWGAAKKGSCARLGKDSRADFEELGSEMARLCWEKIRLVGKVLAETCKAKRGAVRSDKGRVEGTNRNR